MAVKQNIKNAEKVYKKQQLIERLIIFVGMVGAVLIGWYLPFYTY